MIFFDISFLFLIGATLGWLLELFFRRFFSAKRWINPGFLVGPYLPLYGFGLAGLYLLALAANHLPIENGIIKSIVVILVMGITMIVFEYIAGLIFIKRMNIKLWDYSDRWGNIQGIICPLFSLFWFIISALYYLFVNQYCVALVQWLSDHILSLFFIGIFYGVILVDFAYSLQLSKKISKIAKESKIVILYERLKESISEQLAELKEKSNFILAFKSNHSLVEQIKRYIAKKNGAKSDNATKAEENTSETEANHLD